MNCDTLLWYRRNKSVQDVLSLGNLLVLVLGINFRYVCVCVCVWGLLSKLIYELISVTNQMPHSLCDSLFILYISQTKHLSITLLIIYGKHETSCIQTSCCIKPSSLFITVHMDAVWQYCICWNMVLQSKMFSFFFPIFVYGGSLFALVENTNSTFQDSLIIWPSQC